ncbi:MAG: TetR/AcrR family transcriptional regulator C-terminal domain-containing protein [Solirubrobacteraceae bacterium]|nr:TetR/AcrR family transcriptional regulator C-terminal domain-containing protein [Solirubrobacteraceae bacterium]
MNPMGIEGRKAPNSRSGITREAIVDAAAELLAEGGLDALTMRRLGDRLGISAMTLYRYFDDKDALLDAVVDAGTDELELPPPSGPWQEQIAALMRALHTRLMARPFLIELRVRRPLVSPGAMRWTERGMRILREAGLDERAAANAYRALFVYTFGDATYRPRGAADAAARRTRAMHLDLPPDEYPHVTAATRELAEAFAEDTSFESGLQLLINGIAQGLTD